MAGAAVSHPSARGVLFAQVRVGRAVLLHGLFLGLRRFLVETELLLDLFEDGGTEAETEAGDDCTREKHHARSVAAQVFLSVSCSFTVRSCETASSGPSFSLPTLKSRRANLCSPFTRIQSSLASTTSNVTGYFFSTPRSFTVASAVYVLSAFFFTLPM